MRCGISCSWCHRMNWTTDRKWPTRKHCGYRANVPRVQCDCIKCVRDYGQQRAQREGGAQ